MVSWGLAAMEWVRRLDGELGEGLQIGVGVNTGGPLAAVVLGGECDVRGARGLPEPRAAGEHRGVPMLVHMTRHGAPARRGRGFEFGERERGRGSGECEVKGGES
jgi:hypothetical protein